MPDKQYDPVAAAAIAGLDAAQLGVNDFQSETGAPEPPGGDSAFAAAEDAFTTLSQASPFNVFARGSGPSPPGDGGGLPQLESPLPPLPGTQGAGPQDILSPLLGTQGGGSPPNPMQAAQDAVGQATGGSGDGSGGGDDQFSPAQ